jgi:hypothetical protein
MRKSKKQRKKECRRRHQPFQHPGRLGVRLKVAVRDDKTAQTAAAEDAFGPGVKYVLFA